MLSPHRTWCGLFLLAIAAIISIDNGAHAQQSCFAPITPTSLTLEAQTQSIVETITPNDVQSLSVAINWGDNSVLTGGGGTYTHTYLQEGTYHPTLSGTGFLNGNPCSTPPTVFAVVTVTPCTGSNCTPPSVIAQLTSTPPGIFKPLPKTVAKGSVQCGNTINDTSSFYLTKLNVFYASDLSDIPTGWPLIGFCASQDGMTDLRVALLQGAPGFPQGDVLEINVFVTAGYNVVVADGPPPPSIRFGYLGPFYDIYTTQVKNGQALRKNITWGYVPVNELPTGTIPRVLPSGAGAMTASLPTPAE